MKKCCFYWEKVRFLDYVVPSQRIRMEEESIDTIKAWPERKSVQDI